MDIDLLSKMVKEVVMDHDSVTLPSLGSFVTELVPASFTDRGYTILPPYRRLFFSPKQGTDNLLVSLYLKSNPDATEADATRILVDFLTEMMEVLKVRKTIVFPGLGRLRATKENNFFFIADEDLDIYPAGYGLEPISLKTHEETPAETEAAVASIAEMVSDFEPITPEPEPEVIELDPIPEVTPTTVEPAPAPVEPAPAPAQAPEPTAEPAPKAPAEPAAEPAENSPSDPWWVSTLMVLLIFGVVLALAIAVIGRVNPQWIDQFLYSAAELEVLYPGGL